MMTRDSWLLDLDLLNPTQNLTLLTFKLGDLSAWTWLDWQICDLTPPTEMCAGSRLATSTLARADFQACFAAAVQQVACIG